MKMRLTCWWLRREVVFYGMGVLEPREARRVERHLVDCEACRRRVRQVVAADRQIRHAIREAGPSIFETLAQGSTGRRRFWSPALALLAAALLAAALLLGAGPCGLPFCHRPGAPEGCACTTPCRCSSDACAHVGACTGHPRTR